MSVVNQPIPDDLITKCIKTPIGLIEIGLSNDKLWYVEFIEPHQVKTERQSDHPLLQQVAELLMQYANGINVDFTEVLKQRSDYGTQFQRQVWQALTTIPYGETWSYGQLATVLGNPKASRAVGAANGKNPLAILVPCHRVIGSNGSLTGYAGGLDKKLQLLKLESDSDK